MVWPSELLPFGLQERCLAFGAALQKMRYWAALKAYEDPDEQNCTTLAEYVATHAGFAGPVCA